MCLPIAISRHDIVDPELLADLLDAQVSDIRVQLLRGHGRLDSGRQVHQTRRLVIRGITPPVTLATLLRAIRIVLGLFTLRTAAALGLDRWCAVLLGPIFASKATACAKRDGVGTRTARVVSPRHLVTLVQG